MKNKYIGLKIIIIILSALVVVLTGYIVYDKLLNNNTGIENNRDNISNNNSDANNINSNENITEEKIREIFKFVYNYYELPIVYCGKTDNTLAQIYGTARKVSTEFTTYKELLNSLKKYISTDVIADKQAFAATTKEYYLEQDGKLYCTETYKGYLYGLGNIDIEIILQEENKIESIATMELIDMANTKTCDKVDIVLEKNNDNWIVTKYKKQNTESR